MNRVEVKTDMMAWPIFHDKRQDNFTFCWYQFVTATGFCICISVNSAWRYKTLAINQNSRDELSFITKIIEVRVRSRVITAVLKVRALRI